MGQRRVKTVCFCDGAEVCVCSGPEAQSSLILPQHRRLSSGYHRQPSWNTSLPYHCCASPSFLASFNSLAAAPNVNLDSSLPKHSHFTKGESQSLLPGSVSATTEVSCEPPTQESRNTKKSSCFHRKDFVTGKKKVAVGSYLLKSTSHSWEKKLRQCLC